jgi:UDP-arabinose 4-epimerase
MSATILVIGGAGYVGSHACKALAQAGFQPVVYDDLSTGHRWAVKWGPLEDGDLRDVARLSAVLQRHRPAAVMHFAAQALVGLSVAEPALTWSINRDGTAALIAALARAGNPPVVFSSTCSLYGNTEAALLDESLPPAPTNPYAASKRAAEELLAAAPLGSVSLRYFNAAGADSEGELGEVHEPETHLIPNVLKAVLGGAPLTVHGTDYPTPDGSCLRDYVHVADLAAAHLAALRHLLAGGASTTLNLGSGEATSVLQVIAAAERVTGRPVPWQLGPRRPGDPPRLVADASRAARLLGWRTQRSQLETIIADAWAWERRGRAS